MEKGSAVYYALTLTLKPKFRIQKGVNMLAPWQYDNSHEAVLKLCSDVNITLRTVIAELTAAGDIHYHGIVLSEDDLKGIRYNIACNVKSSNVFGFFTVREIDDLDGWLDYISKDLEDTHKLLARPAVVCDDLKLIEYLEFKGCPL